MKSPHDDLFHRISEISSMCYEIDQAIRSLVALHGDQSEPVASAKDLQAALGGLKRELMRHYLECRIVQAAQATGATNN